MRYIPALLVFALALVLLTSCSTRSTPPPSEEQLKTSTPTDTAPPRITLQEPAMLRDAPMMITTHSTVPFSGQVTDETSITQFVINGTSISLDVQGRFQYLPRLVGDDNTVVIEAMDAYGNRAATSYTIFLATKRARDYARDGLAFLQQGAAAQARKALQVALYLEPANGMASTLLAQIDTDPMELFGVVESFPYTVRRGDSLSTIAGQFLSEKLLFYALARYNGIAFPDQIEVGQKLQIPGKAAVSRPPTQVARGPERVRAPEPMQPPPPVRQPEPAPPSDTKPPRIVLHEPVGLRDATIMQVTQDDLYLEGTVTDDSGVSTLFVGDTRVEIDAHGRFRHHLRLDSTDTVLALSAVDIHGNQTDTSYRLARVTPDAPIPTPRPVATTPPIPQVQEVVAPVPQVVAAPQPVVEPPAPRLPELDFGRYHVLAIGNDTYEHFPTLNTAISDARVVAQLLEQQYGFATTLLTDASREELVVALDTLRSRLTSKDNLLIYYAGHGILDEEAGRGYWLPVDAQRETRANWLSLGEVTDTLRAMTVKHAMVVADSCYSGILTRAVRAGPRSGVERHTYLQRLVTKRARTAITSGGLEPVIDGGGGQHSVFAKAFLTVLRENQEVLEAQQLFSALRQQVIVNAPQTPEYANIRGAGHEGGEFLFVPK